jgi:hypothetical protein
MNALATQISKSVKDGVTPKRRGKSGKALEAGIA